MGFTVEQVKSLLQRDLVTELEKVKINIIAKIKQFPYLVTELEKVKINIIAKIKQFPYLSQSKLYEHLTVLKSFGRDLLVERDIQDGCNAKAIALR